MPLFRKPTTQELEDHAFGSGAFSYSWISYDRVNSKTQEWGHFPIILYEVGDTEKTRYVDEKIFIEGIKIFAKSLPDRSFDDLIEDMDAGDVDCVFQIILFGEQKYA